MIQGIRTDGHRAKRLILVVEDNDINREILCALLEDDFDVIEAENGLVGLEQLDKHSEELSLVVLDLYMPVCDGLEFLRRKRKVSRFDSVPVIVATASDSVEDEITCLELGANDFIVKPYNFEIMMNRINNMIRLRESASIVNQLTWDKVTGLYSKEFFYGEVVSVFASFPEREYDLVCSEVENYPVLVDRYGEANCELLLSDLAEYLTDVLPGLVAGGRIGTALLAFLMDHQGGNREWEVDLQDLPAAMPLANASVKFGLVECIDHSMEVPKICNRAASAIETVKGHIGVEVALFDEELHERHILEQVLRDSMESALSESQFSVYYQPKHDVRTGKIGGAEALVRWIHPEIGLIQPGIFIPLFEQNGFITRLDLFVWEEACKELKRCAELGLPAIPISVNVSRLDFDIPDLPERIAALADKHAVDRSLLHVELTETAYSDNPKAVVSTLKRLKEMGFSTELDDFGAGYSSLASLNELPLDIMKLDMSMIRQATELDDFRIIESTIGLAGVLGLRTVVEGVELAKQAEKVTEIGCDMIQGFYYARPLSQGDFEAYLSQDGGTA